MGVPQPGDLIGRYRVDDVVGRGGMGVVFRATDTRLDRTVALKVVLGPHAATPEFQHRFHDEARALSQVDSPYVIRILDHDTVDGTPFIVTQYVDGPDLGRHLADHGPLRRRDALLLCGQVARGLGAVHRAGILHRDVKPGNVLLRDPGTPDQHAYLGDFGVARTEGSEGRTGPGEIPGAWTSLAPERINGAPASPASDLYALGCLLWASLTGGPPYTGSDAELAIAHAQAPVPQLPGTDEETVATNAVLARLLAKDPADRYADAASARDALDELAARIPAEPAPAAGRSGTVVRDAPPFPMASSRDPQPQGPPPLGPPPQGPPPAAPTVVPGGPLHTRRRSRAVPVIAGIAVLAVVAGLVAWLVVRDDGDPDATGRGTPAPGVRGDVDGDGVGDLSVLRLADEGRAPTSLETFTSTGSELSPPDESPAAAPTPWGELDGQLQLADVDGDGRTDQVWATAADLDSVVVDVVPADGEPWHAEWPNTGNWTNGAWPLLADLDRDGRDDLVYYNNAPYDGQDLTLDVALAGDDGFATPETWYTEAAYENTITLDRGDFDGDGRDDLLATVSSLGLDGLSFTYRLQLLVSDGKQLQLEGPEVPYQPQGYKQGVVAIADLDGDGRDEAVLGGQVGLASIGFPGFRATEQRPVWSRSAGSTTNDDWRFLLSGYGIPSADLLTVSDVDGDGDDDLLFLRSTETAFTVEVYAAEQGRLGSPTTWAELPCVRGTGDRQLDGRPIGDNTDGCNDIVQALDARS